MFLLKKFVSRLFFPIPLCLEVLAIGLLLLWFTRKQRLGRILATISGSLLFFFSYGPTAELLLKPLEHVYSPHLLHGALPNVKPQPKPKWIVVLGAGHSVDPSLPVNSQLNDMGLARLVEAIRLYKLIPESRLLLSGGGRSGKTSNAEIMRDVAQMLGVPREDMVVETKSRDTEQEAKLIKPMIKEDPFVLVTSASHVPRSIALFKKLGMNPVAAPAGHWTRKKRDLARHTIRAPSAHELRKSERAVYEYMGLIYSKLTRKI